LGTSPPAIGPYTLLRVLGEGGLGRVHLARTDKGARVVVRVIRAEFAADPLFRTRLRDELDRVSGVRSPRLAAVLDADVDGDVPWVAAEYVPAPSLRDVVDGHGPLPVPGVRLLGIGLAEALEAVHGAGLVHHGLNPGNVLLTHDGPRVTDVGIARAAVATPVTHDGALVRSPGYLAPEQVVHGAGGAASDVFGLGGVLLYAATWHEPFGPGDSAAVLHRVLHVDPNLGGVSPDVAPVVAACLHRDPTRRPEPRQVREVLAAAHRRAAAAAAVATEAPPPAPQRTRGRRRRVASVAAGSAMLLGLLALVGADAGPDRTQPADSLRSAAPALPGRS
jgi:eukaryotic-like serine/threonine-protein kinase